MMFRKQERKIGDYTVVSRIGGGRYGVCFLAHDPLGRKVVLKRFRRRMWKKNRADNHHEAVVLSGLCHPGVPELLGVINARKGYYFVLGYKEGNTLEKWLFKEKKVFTAQDVYRIGTQLFEILEYVHGRNVVHGDISIANVVDDGEQVSLIDFGLARYAGGERQIFRLDYARTANVIIYLLYSGYTGNGRRPWHEELPLTPTQRAFLLEMMDPGTENRENGSEETYDTAQIKKQFQECFGERKRH